MVSAIKVGPKAIGTLLGGVASIAVFYSLFSDFFPTFYGAFDDQRWILCLLVLLVSSVSLVYATVSHSVGDFFRSVSWLLPLCGSFLLGSFVSAESEASAAMGGLFALYFLSVGVLGAALKGNEQALSNTVTTFITLSSLACVLYSLMTLNVYLFAFLDGIKATEAIIPWGFVNIRYWSHLASWLIPLFPLALMLSPLRSNKLYRYILGVGAGIWWWMLVLSSARGSLVAILCALVFVSVFFGRKSFPWLKLIFQHISIGMLFWLILSVVVPFFAFDDVSGGSAIRYDSSGRWPLWVEAWSMSFQNFPFGMGGHSWVSHETITDLYVNSPKTSHPHNMYLMWAAEFGWLCIFAFAVVGARVLYLLWQRKVVGCSRNTNRESLAVGLTSSVVAGLVHASVSAVFLAPASMLVGLFVLAFFWALIQREKVAAPREISRQGRCSQLVFGSLVAAIVAFSGGLWLLKVENYYQAMAGDLVYYQYELKQGLKPGFWFHGYFPRGGAN
ncbi:hypothetical protein D777_01975 [Marinobacter nitratireducens]|uniref:O-antigen ligase-related domain-containing protein n=1 Tax=Marinobacter nitratireducens TaxID=1137280 RepID=A0A072N2C9_9GAMM|nr:O-antigen ligase family protein [Marinobacter nitratireducens]KEF31626.1 hypothetical protein D777_01975 [Marinobacter nitratireducens]